MDEPRKFADPLAGRGANVPPPASTSLAAGRGHRSDTGPAHRDPPAFGPRPARCSMECAIMPVAPVTGRTPLPRPLLPSRSIRLRAAAFVLALVAWPLPAAAEFIYPQLPCYTGYEVNASYAQYPPSCPRGFTSHDGVRLIVDGLPPGSGIYGRLKFLGFDITSEAPGGPLGGEVTGADARVVFELKGTGVFAGYTRTIVLPAAMIFHTGPQVPAASVQSFAVDVFQCFAQMTLDPEFNLLRITAGTNFGLPSPGRAHLVRDETGDFLVDSFWDLRYRVDFVGNPGGIFAGMSGSTTSMHRQRAGMHWSEPCNLPDNGFGTANWTPFCGGWRTKTEAMLYSNGAGTFLIANMSRTPPGGLFLAPGGPFGGQQSNDTESLRLEVIGEGAFAGYTRGLALSMPAQHNLGPVMSGVFQGRVSDPSSLFAEIIGDPDFDLLRIFAGSGFGFNALGHTTLTRGGAADWWLDSFYDVQQRVDFVGAAGSALAGFSGSTISDTRGQAGRERPGYCLVPDNGAGTASFPPFCALGYRGPRHVRGVLGGFPAGSPLLADIEIVPLGLISTVAGGPLGGEVQTWDAAVNVGLTGVGAFAGYTNTIPILVTAKTATAPVTPGTNPQHFETQFMELAGATGGHPHFDLFRITAGTSFGGQAPGHTSLTHAGGSNWDVDSWFDIAYRLDYIGKPLGPFGGLSGSTNDRQRFLNGQHPSLSTPPAPAPQALLLGPARPNPSVAGAAMSLELPKRSPVRLAVHDVAGR